MKFEFEIWILNLKLQNYEKINALLLCYARSQIIKAKAEKDEEA